MALPRRQRFYPGGQRGLFVVVGGGAAGVSCASELVELGEQVLLMSGTPVLREAAVLARLTPHLEVPTRSSRGLELTSVQEFGLHQVTAEELSGRRGGMEVVVDVVVTVDVERRRLVTATGREVDFAALCLCTGAVPKVSALSSQTTCQSIV